MINKITDDISGIFSRISDGATVLVGGFSWAGVPDILLQELVSHKPGNLTIITNSNVGDPAMLKLLEEGCVSKLVSSYPRVFGSSFIEELRESGKLELELIPQGTLAERIRSAGAGIPAFYTPASTGTPLAEGKEQREFNKTTYVMETALHGDVALIHAKKGDRWGNLVYNRSARNFNPVMATAGKVCIAQVEKIVELGELDPETIVTPGIYVDHVIQIPERS